MAGYRERLRKPMDYIREGDARPRQYERTVENGMIVERDLTVPTRDGYDLFVDLFRPEKVSGPVPVLVAWTPYGKHDPIPLAIRFPNSGVKEEWISEYTIFEAPDPLYWTGQGYAVITADTPGTWHATTDAGYFTPKEAEAEYDLVEWAGTQAWSSGKVGLSGVSYLASSQWKAAALQPPHLAAINPWEGWSDTYNEIVRHGGIPETYFWPFIQARWGCSNTMIEDLWALTREHPFFDDYWKSKVPDFDAIKVPAYVVASWSDHGVHTRGTLEAFKKIASEQKWLEVHGNKKWAYYYEPQSVARQTAFFDHFLKGKETELFEWPAVRLHVRDRHGEAVEKSARNWPAEGTTYVRLHLDARSHRMDCEVPEEAASFAYDPLDEAEEAVFDFACETAMELVGHMKLALAVSTKGADDMDLFVAVEKISGGERTPFTHWGSFEDGPVAFGWLRLSRRELDEERSTEYQPVLTNRSEQKVAPGEIVQAMIEILPSGTRFEQGDVLRLRIKGRDIYTHPKTQLYMRHEDTVNAGTHHIHTGPDVQSYLLIPRVELIDVR